MISPHVPSGISPGPRNLEETTTSRQRTHHRHDAINTVALQIRSRLVEDMFAMLFIGPAEAGSVSHCLRSTSEQPAETILDDALLSILGGSSAASTSSSTQRPSGSLATRLAREAGLDRTTQSQEMVESEKRSQYQRQIHRKWQAGDVYSPQDLSGAEQKKWKFGRKKPQSDAFDVLGINPILEYKVGCGAQVYMQRLTSCRTSQ
jgi:small subunit ribosomal protein S18